MSKFIDRLTQAMKEQSWGEYEEAWLDAIEGPSSNISQYITATNNAITAGHGERAGQMMELIHQSGLTDDLSPEKKLEFQEALACSLPRNKDIRTQLLELYRSQFGHIEGFENCVETSGLMEGTRPGDVIPLFKRMVHYQPGSFVKHRSGWGVGEVKELDPTLGTAIVNFQKKEGHSVKLEALPQICEPLEANHYLVLGWQRPEELRRIAEEEPAELIKLVLRTSSRPIPLARIRDALSGVAVPSSSWSKWWARARNAIKKDPLVGQSGGKSNELYLLDGPEALTTSVERRFTNLSPTERLKNIRECLAELNADQYSLLDTQFQLLRRDIKRGDLDAADRVSALLMLKDHSPDGDEITTIGASIQKAKHPADLLNTISREEDVSNTLEVVREFSGENWNDLREEMLLKADDTLRELMFNVYAESEQTAVAHSLCTQVMQHPGKSPLLFLHLVRNASSKNFNVYPFLEGISSSDLYRQAAALFDRLSLDNESAGASKADPGIGVAVKRYRQHLAVKPFALLKQVLESCTLTDAREIYMQLTGARSISDSNLEKAKAIILRKFPLVLAGQPSRGSATVADSAIYSTKFGITKVQGELELIRNVKLPEIFKAIGDAAALGDLSENAEFTSAIEERENLNRRVMEMQGELDRVRVIDPEEASTDQVGLGSKIHFNNLTTGKEATYCLLGPWDGGPDEGVLSYLSPVGKAMLQKKVGDEFEVVLPTGVQQVKILAISRGEVPQEQ